MPVRSKNHKNNPLWRWTCRIHSVLHWDWVKNIYSFFSSCGRLLFLTWEAQKSMHWNTLLSQLLLDTYACLTSHATHPSIRLRERVLQRRERRISWNNVIASIANVNFCLSCFCEFIVIVRNLTINCQYCSKNWKTHFAHQNLTLVGYISFFACLHVPFLDCHCTDGLDFLIFSQKLNFHWKLTNTAQNHVVGGMAPPQNPSELVYNYHVCSRKMKYIILGLYTVGHTNVVDLIKN